MIALFKTLLGGWKLYALAGVVFVVAVGGAYVKGRMDGASICDGRIATAAAEYNEARDKAVAEAEARRALVARHFSQIDAKYAKDMSDAQASLDRLRADVASGRRQLRIATERPAPANVPPAAPGAGVDHAAPAGLGPDAIEAYFTLRRQHREVTERLLACQGILTAERAP